MDQIMRLVCFDRFLQLMERGCDMAGKKRKKIQIKWRMDIPRVLVRSHQRRCFQESLRIVLHFCDLVRLAYEKRLDVTAPPAQRNVITLMFSEWRGTFYFEGNVVSGEIMPKGKLHCCAGHRPTKSIIGRIMHPTVRIRQLTERVGNSTFSQVTGVGKVDEVSSGKHQKIYLGG